MDITTKESHIAKAKADKQAIKCVIWDLDNTLWNGILLEDENVTLNEAAVKVLIELDGRGILNSVSSKNDYHTAAKKLKDFGLWQYFLYPEINWNPKSESIGNITKSLNLGIDTMAFVDDQEFERDEVAFSHPEVFCIDSQNIPDMLDMKELRPKFITSESKLRRGMYQSDITRNEEERKFIGVNEDFLAQLQMIFTIKKATVNDLQRAEELTVRTHQLNTTGYTYSYEELKKFSETDDHLLLVAGLDDKYGTYGTIGLSLIEMGKEVWTVKLLLMSCRVMSRGVGTILMSNIMQRAKKANVRLHAYFIPNDKNKMMYVTYKFGGFKEYKKMDDLVILENDLSAIHSYPPYVKLMGL